MSCCCCGHGLFKRKKPAASHGTPERQSTEHLVVQSSETTSADDLLHVRKPDCSVGAELDSLSTHLHQSSFRESTSERAEIPSKDVSHQSTDLPVESAKRPSLSTIQFGSSSSSSKISPTTLEEVVRSFKKVDIARLGEFIEVIKALLERLVTPQKDSATPSSSNSDNLSGWTKIIETGKTFLSFVSDHAQKVDTKSDLFKSGEAAKIAGDILQQIGQIHWLVGALSITGYLISKCQKVSENQEGCIELLQQMLELASYINNLNILISANEKNEKEEKLLKAFQYIIEGSMFCAAKLDSGKFSSFFKTSVNSDNLNAIRSKIRDFYRNLNAIVNVEMLQGQSISPPVSLPEYPKDSVGIKGQLDEVNSLLKMETSADCSSLVILWGVGGIGKTTLAEAVVSKINRSQYNYARIKLDENFEYNKNKYTEMQQQILKDAFPNYMGGREIKLRDTQDGKDKLKDAFTKGSKAIFLYIDNALDKKDLEELLPLKELKSLPWNSRILITTRTKDIGVVLSKGGLSNDRIKYYSVKTLPDNDGMEILCRDPAIRDRMKADLKRVVTVCQGIPLLLQMVAADLLCEDYVPHRCGMIINDIIKEIKEGRDIYGLADCMVNFVYKKLEEKTQKTFLDICCCFHNSESHRNVENIVGIREVRRLEEAALITSVKVKAEVQPYWVSFEREEIRLSVHDVIRSIGRRLGKSNRIMDVHGWVEAEKDEARLKKIEVVYLPKGNKGYILEGGHLNSMKEKLRILYFEDNINVSATDMVTLPELRIARIYGDISWLNVEALNKLVILTCQQLHIPHTALLKLPKSLKRISILSIKLRDFLKIVPNSSLEELFVNFADFEFEEEEGDTYNSAEVFNTFLVGLNNLEFLHIINCESLSEFQEQICRLPRLKTLSIVFSPEVKCLPESFGQLTNLTHLNLEWFPGLKELPETFGQLTNLTHLNLECCRDLKELPETFGQLTNLTHLNLKWCYGLKELPETFGQLTNLTELDLRGCRKLEVVPETFGQLTNLTHLDLTDCDGLKELPETFGQLEALKDLRLEGCWNLEKLPATFFRLTNLTDLDLRGCFRLKEVVPDIVKGLRNCLVAFHDISKDSTTYPDLEGCTFLSDLAIRIQ